MWLRNCIPIHSRRGVCKSSGWIDPDAEISFSIDPLAFLFPWEFILTATSLHARDRKYFRWVHMTPIFHREDLDSTLCLFHLGVFLSFSFFLCPPNSSLSPLSPLSFPPRLGRGGGLRRCICQYHACCFVLGIDRSARLIFFFLFFFRFLAPSVSSTVAEAYRSDFFFLFLSLPPPDDSISL